MTRIELAGLMLGLLAVSVAGGISWRLFRPHRGMHVPIDYGHRPIRLEVGSMILEEETRLRGDWQDAYVRELAPETLDEENDREQTAYLAMDDPEDAWPDIDLPGLPAPAAPAPEVQLDGRSAPELAVEPDLISVMSDEDFFHMARFEFRRLEWMASEPLTLPAWTGRAA